MLAMAIFEFTKKGWLCMHARDSINFHFIGRKGKFHKNVSILISMAATGKFNANLVKVSG